MRGTRPVSLALPLLFCVAACGSGDSVEAMTAASHESMAGGNKVIGVMTRNLYLGADLGPVIGSTSPQQFVLAASAVWTMVQKNNPDEARLRAVADEIAEHRPALVGLQEAFTWETVSGGKSTVVYDYRHDLLRALAERGLEYRLVTDVQLLQFQAPTIFGYDVRTTDHGAILAREDVHTSNAIAKPFSDANLLPLTISAVGAQLLVKRGYLAVDVEYRGESLRFVSTHLESFHPVFRQLQAAELAGVLAGEQRPVILVGDLNSHPDAASDGAGILMKVGLFRDAWSAVHPADAGLTCCFLEDLTQTAGAALTERIDYVLTRGPLEARSAVVLAADPASRVSSPVGKLWHSDHAGVFAEVRIADDPRDR